MVDEVVSAEAPPSDRQLISTVDQGVEGSSNTPSFSDVRTRGSGAPSPVGTIPPQMVTLPSEVGMPPSQLERTLRQLEKEGDDFDIVSPPRSRGRPKEKPKVAHAKRNIEIAMARENSLMYSHDLSLQTVAPMQNDAMSYESAGSVLTKFKVFVVSKKAKAPVARETIRLPPSKQPMQLDELVRVLPKDMLRNCDTKVTSLQRTRSG
ncbi:hypothetical protein GN958_ATG07413 [Phytophthora infestans]|uniref:Uncharacterized protein n=1 Tax=Phytophthora infestans TaxID=4787 RepID=A0A8S9UR45_PHYIN|nr:hypothetical protein GN958_ATG13721 [Phytophthora infestans]KAF4143396.1 hypothetical protein GN958_ATG07413 [Phytophthora infestans]